MITTDQLRLIAPTLKPEKATEIADLLNNICQEYKITGEDFKHFLAQVCHECGEFSIKRENMYYTKISRLQEVWPTRKFDESFLRNPQKLANTVYADRMGNRDFASGDGYNYRGGGMLQITGRDSYQRVGYYLKIDLANHPELIEVDGISLQAACWEYRYDKKLLGVTDINVITKRINGGYNGLAERKAYYKKILEVLD